jgi:hypothetical protein
MVLVSCFNKISTSPMPGYWKFSPIIMEIYRFFRLLIVNKSYSKI